ncbi:long-chain-fatty-acid--CoA ligase [Skermania sp. ID1734]|uniref:long-chain-fatty-acid--CoA ligase n=1 Tax=Skermania sp. ID1734 TaxID=2597516 RepID=UPI001180C3AF|nr:long-chain-fatty-acid--CoA ligase [Skermania sp. ID1734]TSD98058.1 long-chain-fatty-acid--CoA ligase [Skermania sp. ID1734]
MYLTQTLHRNVQQDPTAIATIYGDRVRTRAESIDRIARLGSALRNLGVRAGDRVGALALNSDRYHEFYLGVPWIGAAITPVNTRWSAAEIAYSLRDSDTRVLLVDDAFVDVIPALRESFPSLETVIFMGDKQTPEGMLDYETLISESEPVEDTRTGGDALAGIFYTGGTTGDPKGVMLSHNAMCTSALGALATGHMVTPGGRMLHIAPMFHLADIALWTVGNVMGSTHVFVPSFTVDGMLQSVDEHRVTDALLVPTMVQMVVDAPQLKDYDVTSLRRILYGASPMSEAVLERAAEAFPSVEFTQAYGMTELAPIATLLSPADHQDWTLRRSAGRAAPHTEVRIVDENDVEVPRGTVGEIIVRGDNVMLGYWNKPEATADAVRNGWMHTGDGGYMNDAGYVFVVDRMKDMIITGGENVYSAEVENAVSKHPAVAQVAVIGVPDPNWGERVHAVVVLRDGHSVEAEELRAHCKELIANYKVPRSAEFVSELPISGAGKILKKELRKKYWDKAGSGVS